MCLLFSVFGEGGGVAVFVMAFQCAPKSVGVDRLGSFWLVWLALS